jgi:2-methylcitrate dehydratase PrpD
METPVGRIMAEFVSSQFGGSEATILLGGKRASAVGATLANGFAGNGLDIDDGYRLVKGHPGACILPVAMAAAEIARPCSGPEFLTALVIGYEVGIRAGLIRHANYQTYHASGSWGAISGVAAAGKILKLDPSNIRNAMGAAEYHAPIAPMMKGIAVPSMVKDGIGWGAMVAMSSVLMAHSGFTGIEPLFSDSPQPEWIEGLGDRFEMMNLYFKPYAACRWAQPAVAGALKLVKEMAVALGEVSRIRVRTFDAAAKLSRAHPRDTEEAQYNLSFPVAAALLDGEVGPHQVLPPRIHDPSLLELADRVEVEVEDVFNRAFPAKAYAEVILHTRDGGVLSSGRMEALWEPPDTLPADAELEAKFEWLVEPVLGLPTVRDISSIIRNLEDIDDVCSLFFRCIRD